MAVLPEFDKALEHRVRLSIMALLAVQPIVDFNTLKAELNLTDGNLASHLLVLEKAEYLTVTKTFQGRKPLTYYAITTSGRQAFTRHLDVLEQFLHATKTSHHPSSSPAST